ncbi:LPS-assembly protein LptD [Actibacterium sp. D379-3]
MRRALVLACLWLLAPLGALAQTPPATLIADAVAIEADQRLVAEGRVEVLFDGYRMTAERVTYDSATDQLEIEGPMRITSADGTVLTAEAATLSPDMTEGLLTSARLVLDQQLQLAAAEMLRVGGRYSVLDKTVASACTVCIGNPVPLWQIRARRIIHDEWQQQLYFEHAKLEVMGVPIFYLPRLRLPDPTLKRANGFLTPTIRVTDGLGAGLKVPYFITLGPHADLTVTPYFSNDRTRTLELRYRRAFRHGEIELNGALSRDDLKRGEIRRYLFAEGRFDLPRDFILNFDIQSVSDPAYLLDYGYSDADRLASKIEATRTRRDEYIGTGVTYYTSLRDSETNQTIPGTVISTFWQRRFAPAGLGGIANLKLEAFGFDRRSEQDIIGRDVSRASARADWRRDWTAANGMVLAAQGALALDYYMIGDDSTVDSPVTRTTPFLAAELRWPFVKTERGGASQVLEPVAQLVWSDEDNSTLPNEDSRSVAFDEGNLFSLSRFPGTDAYEQGLRANLGLSWTRHDPAGWSMGVTVGRILRDDNPNEFSDTSGLDGGSSDWLAAVQLAMADDLTLINRAVFDDALSFTRNELRLDWATDRLDLGSSYIWQQADPTENRPDDSSEWKVDAAYQMYRNWNGRANWRYDFVSDRAARAGLGLQYRNECITVDLSLSRRFTSSTSVRPTTDFGLTISMNGFGNTADASAYRRSCIR